MKHIDKVQFPFVTYYWTTHFTKAIFLLHAPLRLLMYILLVVLKVLAFEQTIYIFCSCRHLLQWKVSKKKVISFISSQPCIIDTERLHTWSIILLFFVRCF